MHDTDESTGVQERMQELENRLQRMEHDRSVTGRSRSVMNRMVPPEASHHFRAAGREQLMGIRALVDHWITRLEHHDALPAAVDREDIPIE
jgi:hypothetical protein